MLIAIPPSDIQRLLRSLSLSAVEIKSLTNWPEALIEDYLSILDNVALLARAVDTKDNVIKKVVVVDITMSPYEITATDETVLYNTDGGNIVTNLLAGVKGRSYRLINVGSGGNKVTINPSGLEKLFGLNASEYMADQEAFLIVFEDTEGWN